MRLRWGPVTRCRYRKKASANSMSPVFRSWTPAASKSALLFRVPRCDSVTPEIAYLGFPNPPRSIRSVAAVKSSGDGDWGRVGGCLHSNCPTATPTRHHSVPDLRKVTMSLGGRRSAVLRAWSPIELKCRTLGDFRRCRTRPAPDLINPKRAIAVRGAPSIRKSNDNIETTHRPMKAPSA